MPDNSAIKDKIEKLKFLDKDHRIFGSESHKYELNAPLSDEQIREFENSYSVTIPAGYKQFLQTVGDGGAGPFYGLYRLDFNDSITPDTAEPFEYTRKKPFSMMEAYDQIPDDVSDEEHEKTLDDICARVNRGLVFLATEGCGMYSVLVVNGEEYGNVWYYDLANTTPVYFR